MGSQTRHFYIFRSEKGYEGNRPLYYKYGSTTVELHLHSEGFLIKYDRPKLVKNLLSDNLFRDALKKIELLYLVRYNRKLKFSSIFASVDGTETCLYESSGTDQLLYSMFSSKLVAPFSSAWRTKEVSENILRLTRKKNDRRSAALSALLMAKSKEYESERFMFFWMAVNGLYGFMGNRREKIIDVDADQIRLMSNFYGGKYYSSRNKKELEDRIREDAVKYIENADDSEKDLIARRIHNKEVFWDYPEELSSEIEAYVGSDEMSPFIFFLFWLPYKLRCKYFHGEKSVPLMCFADESPIPALHFLNSILEDFLDTELVKWLDKERVEKEFVPFLKELNVN